MKPILNASFFRSDSGNEPVREWFKALSAILVSFDGKDVELTAADLIKMRDQEAKKSHH